MGAAIVCSIPGTHLVGQCLRPALTATWMASVDSKSCPFNVYFTFEIKTSCKVRDQVSKEAAALLQRISMS